MAQTGSESQGDTVRFLQSGDAWPGQPLAVQHIETHGAHVFLCGDTAIKIKRDVHYDYMDLSTVALREQMLRRELALNGPAAPAIYRDVVPVVRDGTGRLALGGEGAVVEWALRMHRFAAQDELPAVAARGALTDDLADALGRTIHAYHAAAPVRALSGDRLIRDILAELARVLGEFRSVIGGRALDSFLTQADAVLNSQAAALRERGAAGHVRRGHGDLHMRNIVLIDGAPVLFDALEFDETLGTCDVLYDLGFLLMDLCHAGFGRQAGIVQAAYLLAAAGTEDAGMMALPLFMAIRAAIRAMVCLQTDVAAHAPGASSDEARRYLAEAVSLLMPMRPRLVAIGGVSGSGKTVLARSLAPLIGRCPGAVHLRSDTQRKADGGQAQYDPQARAAVYDRLAKRAETLLRAGQSVVVDATFLDVAQQAAFAAMAQAVGVPFAGIWLVAPETVLTARVNARHGDASDADVGVLRQQLARNPGAPQWVQIDAGGSPKATLTLATASLGVSPGADRDTRPDQSSNEDQAPSPPMTGLAR